MYKIDRRGRGGGPKIALWKIAKYWNWNNKFLQRFKNWFHERINIDLKEQQTWIQFDENTLKINKPV